jgi:membrane-associated phospholipid phosphatase
VVRAETTGDRGPYRVRWPVDGAVMGGAALTIFVTQVASERVVTPWCPCGSEGLWGIDRWAVDQRSLAAKVASDFAIVGVVALPYGLDALDILRSRADWSGFVSDAVVLSEALLVNGAINQLVKLAVRRPRPLTRDRPAGDPVLADPDSYLSFYSSHTSTAFAAGISYATTFALRHPDSAARFLVYGVAATTAGTVGLLRILGGKHFPTDVLTGAAAGTAVGLTVPWLHRARAPVAVPVAAPLPGGGAALLLAGRF